MTVNTENAANIGIANIEIGNVGNAGWDDGSCRPDKLCTVLPLCLVSLRPHQAP